MEGLDKENIVNIDDYIGSLQSNYDRPICLVLSPSDFRGTDFDIANLRHTFRDVALAHRVIVIDQLQSPIIVHVLKGYDNLPHEYRLVIRPGRLTYEGTAHVD